jgi:hypothetical protein
MNSGDWVESMTALVEDHNNNWSLVYYKETDFQTDDDDVVSDFFGMAELVSQYKKAS